MEVRDPRRCHGRAWIGLALALACHVADEAANDFLSLYNPLVRQIREVVPWLPIPTYTFSVWITGLIAAVLAMLLVTPQAFAGRRWIRLASYALSAIMCANGFVHILGSLAWHRFLPGVYSSPLLIAASIWLWRSIPRTQAGAARSAMA